MHRAWEVGIAAEVDADARAGSIGEEDAAQAGMQAVFIGVIACVVECTDIVTAGSAHTEELDICSVKMVPHYNYPITDVPGL